MTRDHNNCPICGVNAYQATSQTQNVGEILNRWQEEMGIHFSLKTWNRYTETGSLQVTLFHCFNCGYSAFEPRIVGSNEFYSEIAIKDYYFPEKWEYHQAIEDIRNRPQYFRLIDMGCGSGEFLDLLKKHLPQIEAAGFEINPTAAQQARVKGHKVYEGNFQEFIHSTENRFDVITLFQVLEHLEDPGKYLQQLSILLSANGVIILAVPNAEGPLRFFRDSLTEIPPHHISRWCESAFKIGMPHFGYFVDKIAYEPLPDYLWDQYLPVLWNTGIWPAQICRDIESSLPIDQRMDEWERINWFKQQMKNLNVRWLHSVPGHSIYVVLSKQSNRSNGLEKSLLVKDAVAKIGYDPEAIRIITNLISSIQADISMVIHDQRIETGIRFGKQQTDLKTWSRLLEEEQYKLREWSAQLIKQRQELEEWSAQLTKQRQELKEWSAQLTKQQQKPEKLKKKVGKR